MLSRSFLMATFDGSSAGGLSVGVCTEIGMLNALSELMSLLEGFGDSTEFCFSISSFSVLPFFLRGGGGGGAAKFNEKEYLYLFVILFEFLFYFFRSTIIFNPTRELFESLNFKVSNSSLYYSIYFL